MIKIVTKRMVVSETVPAVPAGSIVSNRFDRVFLLKDNSFRSSHFFQINVPASHGLRGIPKNGHPKKNNQGHMDEVDLHFGFLSSESYGKRYVDTA
jgi:hypothetical protein